VRRRTSRRTHFSLASLLLAAAAAASTGCFADIFGSSAEGLATAEETFDYGIELASEIRVRLFGKNGDVTVTAVPGSDSVTVRGVIRVSAESSDEAERGLIDVWVDIDQFTSEIIVQTAQPSTRDPRNFVVDYEITVPPFMLVTIFNAAGDVTVSGIGSDLFVENGNGKLTLNNIFGSARAQTRNGAIVARVDLPFGGQLRISTGNGNIDLAIPAETSADLLATAGNGSVISSNLFFSNLFQTDNVISGRLAEGLGFISVASGNGDVTLVGY
jgi:hypothetical protein